MARQMTLIAEFNQAAHERQTAETNDHILSSLRRRRRRCRRCHRRCHRQRRLARRDFARRINLSLRVAPGGGRGASRGVSQILPLFARITLALIPIEERTVPVWQSTAVLSVDATCEGGKGYYVITSIVLREFLDGFLSSFRSDILLANRLSFIDI